MYLDLYIHCIVLSVIVFRGRTQIDSFTQNVQWTFGEGGGKRTGRFSKFLFYQHFSRESSAKKLYSAASVCCIIFLVFKNLDNSDICCPPLEHGHGKHIVDDFMGT